MKDDVLRAQRAVLLACREGNISVDQAMERLGAAQATDSLLGLRLDHQRALRTGIGEVVYAEGKSDQRLVAAMRELSRHGPALASRVSPEQAAELSARLGEGVHWTEAGLYGIGGPEAFRTAMRGPYPATGAALVVSAGAADVPVALEVFGTLVFWGVGCGLITDVGVAGLHRLAPHVTALRSARIVVAVAGMDGALPGVLAGLTPAPVVAVPTSVGYGVGAGGHAALSTMLCSCSPGVAVVNIDNGIGAAAFAAKTVMGAGDEGSPRADP
ncbi:MAG: nickel pincer cofactor biosynthesis protein LarB [Desulfovibrio sp.]|jgi:NCAIR mutase (PurE)-related protein|nr:nickel pincer cofactor biosynthesis protein LarB [Desulfovibrio sp.]